MPKMSLARVIAVRRPSVAQVAQTSAGLAGALADLAQHLAPLQAACVVALALLEAAQHVRRNRDGCVRLAQRAAAVLLDLRAHARARWPPALARNVAKLERWDLPVRHPRSGKLIEFQARSWSSTSS
jgi:hypothetical protein